MTPLIAAATLIIRVIFDSYIVILLLRFILQKLHANWFNPISQFIIKLTELPLKPFKKIIPGFKGFDFSILFFAFIVQLIEMLLLTLLNAQTFPNIFGLFVLSLGEILYKFVYIYIYAIIINALASWIPSIQSNPLIDIIQLIVYPLLSRVRQMIPLIAGIDISPIPAILGLTVINMLIVTPIMNIGAQLALQ